MDVPRWLSENYTGATYICWPYAHNSMNKISGTGKAHWTIRFRLCHYIGKVSSQNVSQLSIYIYIYIHIYTYVCMYNFAVTQFSLIRACIIPWDSTYVCIYTYRYVNVSQLITWKFFKDPQLQMINWNDHFKNLMCIQKGHNRKLVSLIHTYEGTFCFTPILVAGFIIHGQRWL